METPLRAARGLPVQDLTLAAMEQTLRGGRFDPLLIETVSRGLFRSSRHVLIVGDAGVGKTTLLQELARQATLGDHPHLGQRRFLAVDCRRIPSGDGTAFLDGVMAAAVREPQTIWCLDNLGNLFQHNRQAISSIFRDLLEQAEGGIIATVSPEEFAQLLSSDPQLIQRFTRINLEEPGESAVQEIVQQQAQLLAKQFGLIISPEVVERTIVLTSNFLLSERQPAKSIRMLQRVCEDLQFNRTQLAHQVEELQLGDVIQALSQRTGIPIETIAGESREENLESALMDAVVGQDRAIREVARELKLIKAGLNEPGKPASVMLFAGMTGVGKTELAKRIAELYSSSRRLQTYTMANFTEPHSVSGIIGVPPGYVGYEDGGRLINELNADPYSVILLDEAEKAHPNVWKPFLNLFDEGWIVDQRGVKAYADRAIFILTTNAGDRNIAQMTRSGKSSEEITEHVKQALSKVRHERSTQPVFPPAFLARIGRIVVFNPLDEAAMIGIAQRVCRRTERLWLQKRHQQLTMTPEVIAWIGRKGHESNERSGGREGGRIIKKLVSDEIECRIQSAAIAHSSKHHSSETIQVMIEGDEIRVEFSPDVCSDHSLRMSPHNF
ncbi:AAA family ATPase [Planctomicrobium sp. SH661]|uniref:AAA family ATPase n=1 Tax=Planctomicrobium sp. SH661 TaxID=3448124 RepID=UPI003F5C9C28